MEARYSSGVWKLRIMILISFILSLIFIYEGIENGFRIFFTSSILLFVPGYVILTLTGLSTKLKAYEKIPIYIGVSIVFTTLLTIFLSITPVYFSPTVTIFAILIFWVTMESIYILKNKISNKESEKNVIHSNEIFIPSLLCALSFLVGFLFELQVILPHKYFTAFDPWELKPTILAILNYKVSFLDVHPKAYPIGFKFFAANFTQATSLSPHIFSRSGGPLFLGFSSAILFLTARRLFSSDLAVIVPLLFVSNPFLLDRFSHTISENFSFIFLLILLFFLTIHDRNDIDWRIISLGGLTFIAISLTHYLTAALSLPLVMYYILPSLSKIHKKTIIIKVLALFSAILIISVVITTKPYLTALMLIYKIFTKNVDPWRPIMIKDFNILLIFMSVLGALYLYRLNKLRNGITYFVILSLTIVSIFLINLHGSFPLPRLLIYIYLCMSIFSLGGILFIYQYQGSYTKKIKMPLIIFIISIVMYSAIISADYSKYSPYGEEELKAAYELKKNIGGESYLALPLGGSEELIYYVGLHNYTRDLMKSVPYSLSREVVKAKSYEKMVGIIKSRYPGINKVYFIHAYPNIDRDVDYYYFLKNIEGRDNVNRFNKGGLTIFALEIQGSDNTIIGT